MMGGLEGIRMKLALLVLAIASASAQSVTTVWDNAGHEILTRGVMLGKESFDEGHITQICKSVLADGPQRKFVELTFLTSDRSLHPVAKFDHMSFSFWREQYEAAARAQEPTAQMVAINGDAALLIRDVAGKAHKTVLQGQDPLILNSTHPRLELIYFAFSFPPPGAYDGGVDVFARAEHVPDSKGGLALLSWAENLFPGAWISLSIREDPWFSTEPRFPYFYPFANELDKPPSEGEYKKTRTMSCISRSGMRNCSVWTGAQTLY
jgi:hypothetical protein